jgi:hypothetical protein
MVVNKNENGDLQIVEEFIKSIAHSNCEEKADNELALMLEGTAKISNKQLPIMVDEDSKLERLSSNDNSLIYHYTLVNYDAAELDAEVLEQTLKPLVVKQLCTNLSLKPVLDKGGVIVFQYAGKDKVEILNLSVNGDSCVQ